MIKLTVTESQANLVWLALRQAERNALDNEAIKTVDQLVMIRLELEHLQELAFVERLDS